MATTFGLFYDAGRTLPVTQLAASGDTLGLGAPFTQRLFVGPAAGRVVRPASGDDIVLSLEQVDAGPGPGAVRLALSEAGLADATPGAPLVIGQTLHGAVELWLQVSTAGLAAGEYASLTLVSNDVLEADA